LLIVPSEGKVPAVNAASLPATIIKTPLETVKVAALPLSVDRVGKVPRLNPTPVTTVPLVLSAVIFTKAVCQPSWRKYFFPVPVPVIWSVVIPVNPLPSPLNFVACNVPVLGFAYMALFTIAVVDPRLLVEVIPAVAENNNGYELFAVLYAYVTAVLAVPAIVIVPSAAVKVILLPYTNSNNSVAVPSLTLYVIFLLVESHCNEVTCAWLVTLPKPTSLFPTVPHTGTPPLIVKNLLFPVPIARRAGELSSEAYIISPFFYNNVL